VDRLPFVAAAADAAASRTEAEQLMIDQQQALWEALGVAPPTNAVSPSAALPEVPGAPSEINPTVSRAHQLAQRRPLLAYWTREVAAAAARVDGAEVGRRPDVNVVAQVTAARVENAVVTTNTQLGYYGTVGLQFALPLQNRAANGAYELAAQTYAETSLAAQQQRNAIDVEIDALCSALTNLVRSYRERARATAQYELAYAAERQKFRLGTATSMDVVVAQRQYMVASLAVVAEHTTYAIVLARLLHQAGALSAAVHARDAAAVAHALTTSTF
jgi:outer membrane protein TolC